MNLYREESSNPKYNAQRNLTGRTHYVDDDTLRFHKARILETHVADGGLLFALVESVSLVMDGSKRGYRPVIFNLFGSVISRVDLDACYKSSKAASKAMWEELNAINAKQLTLEAIARRKESAGQELDELADTVAKLD